MVARNSIEEPLGILDSFKYFNMVMNLVFFPKKKTKVGSIENKGNLKRILFSYDDYFLLQFLKMRIQYTTLYKLRENLGNLVILCMSWRLMVARNSIEEPIGIWDSLSISTWS